jgi:tetratricopeptide (TPR) repeat protein
MRITPEKMWGVLLVSVGLGVLVLNHSQFAFARQSHGPCPCIAEEYKSEKAYPLYKQAALDWRVRKWEDAVAKYHRVIQKHPSSPLAAMSYMGIGLYLKYHKLYDEAIPEFQKGISMIPQTRDARDAKTSIACIYTAQGKYDDALDILRQVLAQAKDWDEVKYCSYWMKEIT